MTWLLRAVEGEDGRWACRREWLEPDLYDNVADAVIHLRAVARSLDTAELLVNSLNGDVERLGWKSSEGRQILPSSALEDATFRSMTDEMSALMPAATRAGPPARSTSDTQCKIDAIMARLRANRAKE